MPLSAAKPRKHLHTRQVICQGFEREDGLWEIEGQIIDTKTYDIDNQDRGGTIRAGEAVHHMLVRVAVDASFTIREAEAAMDYTPFAICPSIAPDFSELVGLNLGPGFKKALTAKFGGTHGCTHVVELMGPIATTAFQTIAPRLKRKDGVVASRPPMIDRCHAMAADGPVVARLWPQFAEPAKKS